MRPIKLRRESSNTILARAAARGSVEPLEQRLLLSSTYHISSTDDTGIGTLRGAIAFSNANPNSVTTIIFDLEGSGVHTIRPLSPLTPITAHVNIQGTTDSAGNPLIELDGHLAGANANGLSFARNTPADSKPSTVSGLVIDRFSADGILIGGTAPTDVFGCRIGTDPTGKHAHPNGVDGIAALTPNCHIGRAGVGPAFQNLISGNTSAGIEISAGASNTIVQNCLIGTDVSGISARPNGEMGILINAPDSLIGGRRARQGNLISGNGSNGILINSGNCDILGNKIGTNAAGTAAIPNTGSGIATLSVINVSIGDSTDAGRNLISGNHVHGIFLDASQTITVDRNFIGTDVTGTKAVGNSVHGVEVLGDTGDVITRCVIGGNGGDGLNIDVAAARISATLNFIGIDQDLKHAMPNANNGVEIAFSHDCIVNNNTIADNTANGIEVEGDTAIGNNVSENNIFSNGHLGIKLGRDNNTPLPNHVGATTGPNHNQNYPVLTSAVVQGGRTTVTGTLSGLPNTNYFIDFYRNDAIDPTGFGEGQDWRQGASFVTDANGDLSFTRDADGAGFGQFYTTTASFQPSAITDTSEFSKAIQVTGASIIGTVFNDANGNGVFDSNEHSLKGRTVFIDNDKDGLFNSSGDPFGVSDAHGHYRIFGVEPGVNRVRMLGTAGWEQTFPSKSAAFQDVTVAALGTTAGVRFGQHKSTTKFASFAIDIGSRAPYVDLNGQAFAADPKPNPGNTLFDVRGTDDDPLFYIFASGQSISYSFAVPNGKYQLKLFYVDANSTAKGQRTFNVTANGKQILKHFDIFATAKTSTTATTSTTNLTITNKKLALNFKGVLGDATVSAIELIPA